MDLRSIDPLPAEVRRTRTLKHAVNVCACILFFTDVRGATDVVSFFVGVTIVSFFVGVTATDKGKSVLARRITGYIYNSAKNTIEVPFGNH